MNKQIEKVFAYFVSAAAEANPDERRRARLIVAFSLLGALFGSLFGGFYILIGHYWGGGIIGVCCALFGIAPHLLRQGLSTGRAGNHYCLILLAGFMCLCWVEGGMDGHALAWLSIIPLCALLLTSRKGAYLWSGLTFLGALLTAAAPGFGIKVPIMYPMQWHIVVSAMGYSNLVAFLFMLGMIFENGRRTAYDRMQATLTELATANERLTRLNDEKSEFLGIAAHDLKNPLTVVMGCSEMLIDDAVSIERVKRAGTSILKEAQRMRRLISDLLDLNAIEEGRMNVELKPVHIYDATETLIENHIMQAGRKAIAVRVNMASQVVAIADDKGLLQILDNLISNAVKFTKPGGQVGIDCWEDFNHAWVKVSDSGPGISAEDQAKLFGRFTRLSARPTGGESSHGLGLSIVKRLIEAMNGEIRCESAIGKGTAFIVKLAKAPPAEKPAEPKTEPLPTAVALPPVVVDVPKPARSVTPTKTV